MIKKFLPILCLLIAALCLFGCVHEEITLPEKEETPDVPHVESPEITARIPMVMINGNLYYDTGRESTIEARCGVMDGSIASTVSPGQIPTQNDQSNFGAGYSYQFTGKKTVELLIDNRWFVFEKRGGDGSTIVYRGISYDRSLLSQEDLDWFAEFLELSEEEQDALTEIPAVFASDTGVDWQMSLSAQNVTPSGMTLVCTHRGEADAEYSTGSPYSLERYSDVYGEWQHVPTVISEDELAWTMELWLVTPGQQSRWDLSWSFLYGELPDGEYRLVKSFSRTETGSTSDTAQFYAYFELS